MNALTSRIAVNGLSMCRYAFAKAFATWVTQTSNSIVILLIAIYWTRLFCYLSFYPGYVARAKFLFGKQVQNASLISPPVKTAIPKCIQFAYYLQNNESSMDFSLSVAKLNEPRFVFNVIIKRNNLFTGVEEVRPKNTASMYQSGNFTLLRATKLVNRSPHPNFPGFKQNLTIDNE